MADPFRSLIDLPAGERLVLHGNLAFALGCVRAGLHGADGYPGTPSTEIIDKGLAHVQDRMRVGWSTNEAVAVGVALGQSMAGADTVVTMKVPGLFQAADVVTNTAFYPTHHGALLFFVATDLEPSSTQHVIDARAFLASASIPILEPATHQDMYEAPALARRLAHDFHMPVAILTNGRLCHSEGVVTLGEVESPPLPPMAENLSNYLLLPAITRANYDRTRLEKLPRLRAWLDEGHALRRRTGRDGWGIITSGITGEIAEEALALAGVDPHRLHLTVTHPVPVEAIRAFVNEVPGPVTVLEDGGRFLQERCMLAGLDVRGKTEDAVRTDWTPDAVLDVLELPRLETVELPARTGIPRPPGICAGCPYRCFGDVVGKLRKKGTLYAVFGDIGCNTLLMFLNALDTCTCMGASESKRQGFVVARPDMAGKVLSVLGDSTECHSGLDATRNAIFRNLPGVKVVLDNFTTAMTGGQPAPSSPENLAGEPTRFDLVRALEGEGAFVETVNAYDLEGVKKALLKALDAAADGSYTVLVLQGACMQKVDRRTKARRRHVVRRDACKRCGLCTACQGIMLDDEGYPYMSFLCNNCGDAPSFCVQKCPFGAWEAVDPSAAASTERPPDLPPVERPPSPAVARETLPASLRISSRGVGGQGILFLGKVLARVALACGYASESIIKGETHGMAQLGGSVSSVFACGDVHSPLLAAGSADVLVALEESEVLREGFLEQLRPGGTVLLSRQRILPTGTKAKDYPSSTTVDAALKNFVVRAFDPLAAAKELGDAQGRSVNVVALGVLSTTPPLDRFPEAAWVGALLDLSPGETMGRANVAAFRKGRELA